MPKKRFKIIPAVYLILVKNNKILLMRRFNTGYQDGKYSLPAGHKEAGENPTEALTREVKEEIGIDIVPTPYHLVHIMARMQGVDSERIDLFFHVGKWKGSITNCEPEKCDHIEWFDIDNLPNETIPYIQEAIGYWKKGISYSEGTS